MYIKIILTLSFSSGIAVNILLLHTTDKKRIHTLPQNVYCDFSIVNEKRIHSKKIGVTFQYSINSTRLLIIQYALLTIKVGFSLVFSIWGIII
jgi:hypothetical protein